MNPKLSILPFFALILLSCASYSENYPGEDSLENVAYYSVEKGNLVPDIFEDEQYMDISPENRDIHNKIWNRSLEIIPDNYKKYIKHFRISSDGFENIMAYVEPLENDTSSDMSSWTLSVDIIDVLDHLGNIRSKEMDETLIHEFAHILSLNSEQTKSVAVEDDDDFGWMESWDFTDSYRSFDSISLKDSYLNLFFQEFWGKDQLNEWMSVELENEADEDYYSALIRLGIKYHTDFVSDYALTDPEEDFAESFTYFIINERAEGDLISQKKINFFYQFPELVEIRDEIRAVLPIEAEI